MGRFFKLLFFLLLVLLAIAEVTYLTVDPELKVYIFNKDYYDAMDAAVQLGRLDVVSALLGIVGVLLAIFGLIGFGYIKSKAEHEAKNTARETAKEETPKIVKEWLEENGIPYMEHYFKMSDSLKDMPKGKANEIVTSGSLDSDGENGGEQ